MTPGFKCGAVGAVCAASLTVIVAGYWFTLEYSSTPSTSLTPPQIWPAECGLKHDSDLPTLLVFIHPKCPCTRATIRELERLITKHPRKMTVLGVVYLPNSAPPEWAETNIVDQLRKLPGIRVHLDDDGQCRRQFRATASGQCLLYDLDGSLLFQGGITMARGHEGPSVGQDSLSDLIEGRGTRHPIVSFYGCEFGNEFVQGAAQ